MKRYRNHDRKDDTNKFKKKCCQLNREKKGILFSSSSSSSRNETGTAAANNVVVVVSEPDDPNLKFIDGEWKFMNGSLCWIDNRPMYIVKTGKLSQNGDERNEILIFYLINEAFSKKYGYYDNNDQFVEYQDC